MRASRERVNEARFEADQTLSFNKAELEDQTKDFGELISYKSDILAQSLLHKRQDMAYNLLNSGVGIMGNDSAGQLLRFQSYQDEMTVKGFEAEQIYHRPRYNINEGLIKHKLNAAEASLPFEQAGVLFSGAKAAIKGIGELKDMFKSTKKK